MGTNPVEHLIDTWTQPRRGGAFLTAFPPDQFKTLLMIKSGQKNRLFWYLYPF